MYALTPIQIEEDKRDAADEAEYLSREMYYFWNRTDGAEVNAYCLALLNEQEAELAAYLKQEAEMHEAWWDAISRNDR
jgi:hypothetical protein